MKLFKFCQNLYKWQFSQNYQKKNFHQILQFCGVTDPNAVFKNEIPYKNIKNLNKKKTTTSTKTHQYQFPQHALQFSMVYHTILYKLP